jgi:signal transduction histidine kinase
MNRSEFSIQTGPVDVAAVAREAVQRHEAAARDLDLRLTAEGAESWVEADYDRLLQIASNLVENALRETPAGGAVTVEAGRAELRVSDTGPGIPPEDVPHAFERFYLYDKIGKGRPVGSGLGLAIVRQLATAMGGSVSVQSTPGGTTFSVALRPQAGGVDDLEVGARERAQRV